MIPYIQLPQLDLGPFHLQAFGVLSALGVIVGAWLAQRAALKYGPGDDSVLARAIPWAVGAGLLGGHVLHFVYHPEQLTFLSFLKVWEGLSSMGGVLGGLIGFLVYFRVSGHRLLAHADALALGIAPGWAIARLGCFAVHDHPGVPTDFFLGVDFPPGVFGGVVRHDLGLYDALVLGALTVVLYLVARRPRPEGTLIGILAVGYAVPRFFLDFLRAYDLPYVDGRYLGLTPAQYTAFFLVGIGTWVLWRARKAPRVTPEMAAGGGDRLGHARSAA